MNKIKKLCISIIFFIGLMLICNKANATNISISPSEPKVGDEVTITVTVPNVNTSTVTANVSGVVSGKIKVVGGDLSGNPRDYSNSAKYKCEKEGTINVEISSDSSAVLKAEYVDVSAKKSVTVKAKEVANNTASSSNTSNNTTTASKSTEARLSNFGIKPNDFSGFKRDKTEYSTEVPNNVTKVNVYATALDKNAKVSGAGDVQLKEGKNTVKVTVTAEAGNTKVYTLTIKRRTAAEDATATTNDDTTTTNTEATTSDAFGLESLDIKDVKLKPSFKTEIYKYEIDLDKDLSQLDISTIPTDDDTTVEIAGNEDLKDGENLITIVVANKKTKETATYQITVNKNVEVGTESNGSEQVEEFSWLKPSTWGKEDIIKGMIIAVLLLLIIIAIILKVKLSKEKKETKNIDLPGADELDKAIAEHQELSELERLEMNIFDTKENNDINSVDNKTKRRGKHF